MPPALTPPSPCADAAKPLCVMASAVTPPRYFLYYSPKRKTFSLVPITSKRVFQGDIVVWVIFFLLCIISLIEVYSAAATLTYKSGDYIAPLIKQAGFLGFGTIVVWFFHSVPCRFFRLIPIPGWILSIVLLSLTFVVGTTENESSRWINIGFQFQPSELAKGTAVIGTAFFLSMERTAQGASPRALSYILTFTLPIILLIFPENFSTAGLLFATIYLMLFIGRIPMRQMGRLTGLMVAIGALAIALVTILPQKTLDSVNFLHRLDTWKGRIMGATPEAEMNDTIYLRTHKQEAHAAIAIATSNVVGKLPGNSEERDHLSQAFSDFIYAIIIEEMGIEGGILVVVLYIVLLVRAGRIASRCERNFPAFMAMGLAIMLVMQAMINVLVATGLAPVTGQPLPLISRGGTSTLVNCAYIGIILSVSRYARKVPEENDKAKVNALTADAGNSGNDGNDAKPDADADAHHEAFTDNKGMA